MKLENETLNETLRMVKHNHRELIHYTQYHLVDYTEDHISQWGLDTKREVVSLLVSV